MQSINRIMLISVIVVLSLFFSQFAFTQQQGQTVKDLSIDEYKTWMSEYFNQLPWMGVEFEPMLNKQTLSKSLELGTSYIVNNQNKEGNFNYELNFIINEVTGEDNQVRQAGGVWALALMYAYKQDVSVKKGLDKGLTFFLDNTVQGLTEDSFVISYPSDQITNTNTVAIITLTIIDYLTLDKNGTIKLVPEYKEKLNNYLTGYLNHLISIRLPNKHFSSHYDLTTKTFTDKYDPYADGETILAFIKAAKYLGKSDLVPIIEESSIVMARHYTYEQWISNYDSHKTKGFFQWSCMAFWEYQDAGWKDAEFYKKYVLSLAWWMINVHKTLYRQANTGYVYEGIIPALKIARDMKMKNAVNDLEYTIDRALYKLTTWQVGGPLESENFFLVKNPPKDKRAIGGIMNFKNHPVLRIDVTQHQMHAVIMALENVYK